MDATAPRLLLLTGLFEAALSATFGVNIYVSKNVTWSEARGYCTKYFTDLSSVSSQGESKHLVHLGEYAATLSTGSSTFESGWTGLHKDFSGTWKWSGVSPALFFQWIPAKDLGNDLNCVVLSKQDWQVVNCEEQFPFFCFQTNLALVKESKSWEAAMEHCQGLNKELLSLSSELQLTKVLQTSKMASTAHVWTGLRYLGDSWVWVNGINLENQTWSQDMIPQCPAWKNHCGALSLESGQMETWDCADELNFICY
nr:lymphocyte antigen 75-like [Nothobranchius furzeri]